MILAQQLQQWMFEKAYLLLSGCVQKRQKALYKTRGRENRIILGLTSDGTGGGEQQSVLCVVQQHSDWDRVKVEWHSASASDVLGLSSVRAEPEEVNV